MDCHVAFPVNKNGVLHRVVARSDAMQREPLQFRECSIALGADPPLLVKLALLQASRRPIVQLQSRMDPASDSKRRIGVALRKVLDLRPDIVEESFGDDLLLVRQSPTGPFHLT